MTTTILTNSPEEFYARLVKAYKNAVVAGAPLVSIDGQQLPIEAAEDIIETLAAMLNSEGYAQFKMREDAASPETPDVLH